MPSEASTRAADGEGRLAQKVLLGIDGPVAKQAYAADLKSAFREEFRVRFPAGP